MFSEERVDKFERRSTPTYILPIYYTILFDAKVRDLTTKRHTYTHIHVTHNSHTVLGR